MKRLCLLMSVSCVWMNALCALPVKNIDRLINAVVDVVVSDQKDSNNKDEKESASGTGFIISEDGNVVTSCHVIYGATEIKVVTSDGISHIAKVVGRDERCDIALLKIDTSVKLPTLEFADSDKIQVTDPIIVIGNPFGFNKTVTYGIISYKGRNLSSQMAELGSVGDLIPFVQIDATADLGNSGGPVLNLDGKVVALVSAVITGGRPGFTFCTPSNLVKTCVEQLKTYGKIKRSWIGLKMSLLDVEVSTALGFNETQNVYVVDKVERDSPAYKVGIQSGDIVISIGDICFSNDLSPDQVLNKFPADKPTSIQIMRGSVKRKYSVMVVSRVDDEMDSYDITEKHDAKFELLESLDIGVSDLSSSLRSNYDIPSNVSGVLISKVNNDFDLLGVGNVIVSVNQINTPTINQLKEALVQLVKQKKTKAALYVYDPLGRQFNYVAVTIRKISTIVDSVGVDDVKQQLKNMVKVR